MDFHRQIQFCLSLFINYLILTRVYSAKIKLFYHNSSSMATEYSPIYKFALNLKLDHCHDLKGKDGETWYWVTYIAAADQSCQDCKTHKIRIGAHPRKNIENPCPAVDLLILNPEICAFDSFELKSESYPFANRNPCLYIVYAILSQSKDKVSTSVHLIEKGKINESVKPLVELIKKFVSEN